MLAFYLCVIIFICLVAYAGVDATMRLFAYLDLELRYLWIRFRMYLMARKLKAQLIKSTAEYKEIIQELQKDD